jgi:hypothetical protein
LAKLLEQRPLLIAQDFLEATVYLLLKGVDLIPLLGGQAQALADRSW